MRIEPLSPADAPAVEALLDEAFGVDRHTRTAYRLRDGASSIPDLSLAAREDGLIGSVQCWPVLFVDAACRATPLVLLGPVAVGAAHRDRGIGSTLIRAVLARVGQMPVMLIGDVSYYGRFGFTADHTARWRLPGPVERERLLARRAAALDRPGAVRPATCERIAA
jgi:predicted N-acetyltransferase YhbS